MLKNIVLLSCLNLFGDFVCGVNMNVYVVFGMVLFGDKVWFQMMLFCLMGFFDFGIIIFISGENEGIMCMIKQEWDGFVMLVLLLVFLCLFGDIFIVYLGCNNLDIDVNGCLKFNNLLCFCGMLFILQLELLL